MSIAAQPALPGARDIGGFTPPDWMAWPETHQIMAALGASGRPVRFVGGCVRDALLGLKPYDIDIATPEPPERVLKLLAQAKIRAIPTGLDHGTVTAVIPPRQFQITSLRRDIETDGRHAVVRFAAPDDPAAWAEDAARRDFTINALYADTGGRVEDFTGGLADLAAGLVRFIGAAEQRIREDYLRALRFFRFHARFAQGEPDAAAMTAIAEAAREGQGIAALSAERVRDEILRLLALPRPGGALAPMRASGLLAALLPEARLDPERLDRLAGLQRGLEGPEADGATDAVWLRLALLLPDDAAGRIALLERLKLSNAQRHRLDQLLALPALDWAALMDPPRRAALLYQHGAVACRDGAILLALGDAAREWQLPELLAAIAEWRRPVFPLRGADLLGLGLSPGPNISLILKELEAWWAQEGFRPDRAACLAALAEKVRIETVDPAEDKPDAEAEKARTTSNNAQKK